MIPLASPAKKISNNIIYACKMIPLASSTKIISKNIIYAGKIARIFAYFVCMNCVIRNPILICHLSKLSSKFDLPNKLFEECFECVILFVVHPSYYNNIVII